jgi:hypothetical protein
MCVPNKQSVLGKGYCEVLCRGEVIEEIAPVFEKLAISLRMKRNLGPAEQILAVGR